MLRKLPVTLLFCLDFSSWLCQWGRISRIRWLFFTGDHARPCSRHRPVPRPFWAAMLSTKICSSRAEWITSSCGLAPEGRLKEKGVSGLGNAISQRNTMRWRCAGEDEFMDWISVQKGSPEGATKGVYGCYATESCSFPTGRSC